MTDRQQHENDSLGKFRRGYLWLLTKKLGMFLSLSRGGVGDGDTDDKLYFICLLVSSAAELQNW